MATLTAQAAQDALSIGEPIADDGWTDAQGNMISLYSDSRGGRPTVLVVCAAPMDCGAILSGFRDRHDAFLRLGGQVIVVSPKSTAELAPVALMMGLPMPLVSDPQFLLGRAAGLPAGGPAAWRVVILSPLMHIEQVVDPSTQDPAAVALAWLQAKARFWQPHIVTAHPPVLILPDVLPPQLCRDLITVFERSRRYRGGTTDGASDYVVTQTKVREDAMVGDTSPEGTAVFEMFRRRVFPEMYKAFKYRVTRIETMRLGCYDSSENGRFGPHRDDNVPRLRHRRFGFTINLNPGEYEGGFLRFPEYGPQLYAPEAGGIVVFSASLLHEATPVTKGKRFGMFGFLFGEEEERWRHRINPKWDSTQIDVPSGSRHYGRGTEDLPNIDPDTPDRIG
jgi:predicted 2-oxoglutarate/Fe(II)-dependent dioxygenase YbiX/peroxiredoxin